MADRSYVPHVFLVEDDALIAMGIVSCLNELGARVTWASSVDRAIDAMGCPTTIDLAIVDINLGDELSTPVIERLLEDHVATVLCTGYDVASIDERYRLLPRTEKPFTRSRIRELMSGRGLG